jgi:hypothetical protein
MSFRSPLHKTVTDDTVMITGPDQVATEEHSLPRMSDGEDNDDLYESDAPSEESERDEDSPQEPQHQRYGQYRQWSCL